MTEPLMPWLRDRAAGVLLHPTCLHDSPGCGVLGKAAREFIDFLAAAEMVYWQILPLGPTGFGDSPYQCFSAFAGNPFLIDFDPLVENGLLTPNDLVPLGTLPRGYVDYGRLYRIKWPLLRLAWRRFRERGLAYIPNYGRFDEFCENERHWLDPYAAFMAVKAHFGGRYWGEWPEPLRNHASFLRSNLRKELGEDIGFHAFTQYLVFGQWALLRDYAARNGVDIIGDAPIFVALDSADVWASPELFKLDEKRRPSVVAGVPPDYFSEEGQLWGNPLYNWSVLADTGYAWWLDRLRAHLRFFDVVRLDHFRGFYDYWEVPAGATTAKLGKWRKGPGLPFFETVKEAFPDARLIAEDLGEIGPEVRAFREATGLPGMNILQFAFSGESDNEYLPHNHDQNSVVYPGTHDNNTTLGWYESVGEDIRDQVRRYLRVNGEDVAWDFLRCAYRSVSRIAIVPMQDLMSLDARARMNLPGTAVGNWTWRMEAEAFRWQRDSAPYLRELAWLYGR